MYYLLFSFIFAVDLVQQFMSRDMMNSTLTSQLSSVFPACLTWHPLCITVHTYRIGKGCIGQRCCVLSLSRNHSGKKFPFLAGSDSDSSTNLVNRSEDLQSLLPTGLSMDFVEQSFGVLSIVSWGGIEVKATLVVPNDILSAWYFNSRRMLT